MSIVLMIVISLFSGSLSTMNLWAVSWDHLYCHINDVYMIVMMTLWMLIFTLLWDQRYLITILCIVGAIVCFLLIRHQWGVTDQQFLKGMIPHHSMALLMAQKIKEKTHNPVIYQLADRIIVSQNQDILLMKNLLSDFSSSRCT